MKFVAVVYLNPITNLPFQIIGVNKIAVLTQLKDVMLLIQLVLEQINHVIVISHQIHLLGMEIVLVFGIHKHNNMNIEI